MKEFIKETIVYLAGFVKIYLICLAAGLLIFGRPLLNGGMDFTFVYRLAWAFALYHYFMNDDD